MPEDALTHLEALVREVILFIPSVVAALVIFALSLVVGGLLHRAARRALAARQVDEGLTLVLARLTRWTVIVLGLIAALQQVNFDVTSFLAGLGIVGLTIGFALQDIAKNFVAGILLLVQQPFDIGDSIKVAGYEGDVLDVTITYTTLKTWDGLQVHIPNAQVYTDPITNYSALPMRRSDFTLRLASRHDPAQASQVFLEAMRSTEGVAPEPAPFIVTDGLMAGHFLMQVYYHVDQTVHSLTETQSRVVRAVHAAAQQSGFQVF